MWNHMFIHQKKMDIIFTKGWMTMAIKIRILIFVHQKQTIKLVEIIIKFTILAVISVMWSHMFIHQKKMDIIFTKGWMSMTIKKRILIFVHQKMDMVFTNRWMAMIIKIMILMFVYQKKINMIFINGLMAMTIKTLILFIMLVFLTTLVIF